MAGRRTVLGSSGTGAVPCSTVQSVQGGRDRRPTIQQAAKKRGSVSFRLCARQQTASELRHPSSVSHQGDSLLKMQPPLILEPSRHRYTSDPTPCSYQATPDHCPTSRTLYMNFLLLTLNAPSGSRGWQSRTGTMSLRLYPATTRGLTTVEYTKPRHRSSDIEWCLTDRAAELGLQPEVRKTDLGMRPITRVRP